MSNLLLLSQAELATILNSSRAKVDRLERENAALRSLLREAIRDHVDPYDLPESDDYIARVKTALGEGQL